MQQASKKATAPATQFRYDLFRHATSYAIARTTDEDFAFRFACHFAEHASDSSNLATWWQSFERPAPATTLQLDFDRRPQRC